MFRVSSSSSFPCMTSVPRISAMRFPPASASAWQYLLIFSSPPNHWRKSRAENRLSASESRFGVRCQSRVNTCVYSQVRYKINGPIPCRVIGILQLRPTHRRISQCSRSHSNITTIPGKVASARDTYVLGVGIGDLITCWFLLASISNMNLGRAR